MTWVQSYRGNAVSLVSPDPREIEIEDIAYGLSHIRRFSGATKWPWSVAQHSLLVCQIAKEASPTDHVAHLWALLHDAHEYATGDITSPMQRAVELLLPTGWPNPIKAIQSALDQAIAHRFDIDWNDVQAVKDLVRRADMIALATEKAQLMVREPQPWIPLPPAHDIELQQIGAGNAEWLFMLEFDRCYAAYRRSKTAIREAAE
jgi:hypothetical protein